MLEVDRVVKRYQAAAEEVRAIDGVSLTLTAGELVALHGPSGSGKTTLLKLIAGLLQPEQGVIRYMGRDVSSLSSSDVSEYLMHEIGFIRQSFHLMPKVSAVDNAALKLVLSGVRMREAKEQAIPWLHRVGLGERLDHTPEQLSGGERQRVMIARVLAADPRLVLADEPTGNLDSVRSTEIVALLRSIAREGEACVLLVTHDTETATIADRRCTLRDGKLSEDVTEQGDSGESYADSPTVRR